MKLCLRLLITPGLLFSAVFPGVAKTVNEFSIGEAYLKNQSEFLYQEIHCKSQDKLLHRVLYTNSAGDPIADKTIDYASGVLSPSFEQRNFRTNEIISVQLDFDTVTLSFVDNRRNTTEKTLKTSQNNEVPLVVDAGFDAYIRSNWEKLLNGETMFFQFPVATRSSIVELRVSASECSYETETDQCFNMEMGNWFYRMLVSPIELGYDAGQQNLTRYRGLSNIEGPSGNTPDVDIRYRYGNLPQQACSIDRPQG